MKKYLQKIIGVLLAVCILCCGCSRQPQMYQKIDTAMGTIVSQTIYLSADADADMVTTEVISCINALEKEYLSWRLESSEIYQINAGAGSGQQIEMSALLSNVFEQCKKIYVASGGAFDFTRGSVARLWNIDSWARQTRTTTSLVTDLANGTNTAITIPTGQQLDAALAFVGAKYSNIDGSTVNLPKGMQLDLGAVGKGIALDSVEHVLAQQEAVTGAVISVGGSILTYGGKPDGSLWNVGIVYPFDIAKNIGILTLPGGCSISTSGDYERYVEVDGIRYHHILDPDTGYPADSGVKSVTILFVEAVERTDANWESAELLTNSNEGSSKGLFSDALSTACFVMGVEKGLELADALGAEALFVDSQGDIHMTEGMEQYFYLSNAGK